MFRSEPFQRELTVLLVALFWNLAAIDYVIWMHRDFWPEMPLKGPLTIFYALLPLSAMTILSMLSSVGLHFLISRNRSSVVSGIGHFLSMTPYVAAFVTEIVYFRMMDYPG